MCRSDLPLGVVAATVLAVAGCGGSSAKTTGAAPAPTTSQPTVITNEAGPPSNLPNCARSGINPQHLREGKCVRGGTTLVIVNRTTTLHLKSLDAKLKGSREATTVSPSGAKAPSHQKFAIFSITFTNRLGTPQHWQADEDVLFVSTRKGSGNTYGEDVGVESSPGSNSCLMKIGGTTGGIRPHASITCDLVYAIPADANATSFGSTLDMANFGHAEGDPSQLVGVIRTFH